MYERVKIRWLVLGVLSIIGAYLINCGGAGPPHGPPGGETATVIIEGFGASGGFLYDDEKVLVKDAGEIAIGTGDPSDAIESAADAAILTCEFAYGSTTPDTLIDVVANSGSCASLNKCIVCTTTSGSTCSISCTGTVPSNTETANDYVTLGFAVTSSFATDVEGGALRYDGTVTSWPEFDPSDGTLGVQFNTDNCDGNATTGDNVTEMLAVEDDPLGISGLTDVDEWHTSFSILDLGDTSQCVHEQFMMAHMYLTGADVGGSTVDLTGGTISVYGAICNDVGSCPGPP